MEVKIISFGFHYGIPEGCYAVFDARHIKNPHNSKKLRKLTGLDAAVQEDVFSTLAAAKLIDKMNAAIAMAAKENKPEITLGVGCSFGHHRSVALAQRAGELFRALGINCEIEHRDIGK